MAAARPPVTPAVRELRRLGIAFTPCPYRYAEKGGAPQAARELGVPLAAVVKTLVFEDDRRRPLIVIQHGDRDTSAQALARLLGVRRVRPCAPERVEKLTGYRVGGVSPFGTRQRLPVYLEATIAEWPEVYLNGGKRGFLVGLRPAHLIAALRPERVRVAADKPLGTGI